MTDVETTVRTAMRDGTAMGDGTAVTGDWAEIDRRTSVRRRRRRRAERAAFVGSLVAAGGVAAVALRSGGEPTSPAAGPVPGGMGLGATAVFGLVALGVAVPVGLGVRTRSRRPSGGFGPSVSSSVGRARLATVLTVVSLVVPLWAYASHLRIIDDRVEQLASLDGVSVVGVDRHRSPMVGTYQPLATVVVDTTGPGGEASSDLLAADGWVRAAPRGDGLVVDLLRGWWPDPLLFAAALLLGTLGVAAAGLLLHDRPGGRWLGRSAVAASGVQCGLVVLALWRAHAALRAAREVTGLDSFGVDELSTGDYWSLRVGDTLLSERIADVGGALYPLGSLSIVPVLVAWLLGAAAGWRDRARVAVSVVGVVIAVATIALFPDNDAMLWILD